MGSLTGMHDTEDFRPHRLTLVTHPASIFVSYVLVFALLAIPWLREAAFALPVHIYSQDSVLIVWVLAWVAHSIVACPREILNAPINFPAPAQLTGTEHFASI